MFRLTREVRFTIPTDVDDDQLEREPTNSYAGYPSMRELGFFFRLRATLAGELDPSSNYLLNIKQVDRVVREHAIRYVRDCIGRGDYFRDGSRPVRGLFELLKDKWRPAAALDALALDLTPFQSVGCLAKEFPMVRLSQRFEFSATHRLHNPRLSDEQNRQTYGKCNNPHGHGHNYEVQVTLAGEPDDRGVLVDVPVFERTVAEGVIDRFDHKNLNLELPEFRELIPSVENIAMVIYRLLKPRFEAQRAKLAAVTVWETPKTWCEYSE
jgi:6-pyruvoyltetrahydropterin/6-carboxytetrahydropterin synthase